MICIIRIRGEVGLRGDAAETLNRTRLRKKYSCVVWQKPKAEDLGILKKIKDFVAYGEISGEIFEKLIEKRGKWIDKNKKTGLKKAAEEIIKGKLNEIFPSLYLKLLYLSIVNSKVCTLSFSGTFSKTLCPAKNLYGLPSADIGNSNILN